MRSSEAKRGIAELTRGYEDKSEYFVDRLARGLAGIAAAYHPKPVIVRMSDFKASKYADRWGREPAGITDGPRRRPFRWT